jgi:hypothetical protein
LCEISTFSFYIFACEKGGLKNVVFEGNASERGKFLLLLLLSSLFVLDDDDEKNCLKIIKNIKKSCSK